MATAVAVAVAVAVAANLATGDDVGEGSWSSPFDRASATILHCDGCSRVVCRRSVFGVRFTDASQSHCHAAGM